MIWRPLDREINLNIGGRLLRNQRRLGEQGDPIKNSPVRAHHGALARAISRDMNRLFSDMTEDGFAFRTVRLEDGTLARLVIQNGVERLEAFSDGTVTVTVTVTPEIAVRLILEHGILTSASEVALSTALQSYYIGSGTRQPGGAKDVIYGYADDLAAPNESVQWSSVTAPADHDPTLATQELLDNFFINPFTDSVLIAGIKRMRQASLWTGLARWLAQIWGPYRDIIGYFEPKDRPWLPPSMPFANPQNYGLVRDVDTNTTPPTLSYWMVFIGGTGGFGGTGDNAIGANAVGAIKCTIAPECQSWADSLVVGELPADHPTDPGRSLSETELAYYEAVVLAGLEIATDATPIELIPDVGVQDSFTPWSHRAHGMQWAPITLGDLSSAQWTAKSVQWRWHAGELNDPLTVQNDYRTLSVEISFTGTGETRAPTATATGLDEEGQVCWPWDRYGFWVNGLRVVLRKPNPDSVFPHTWSDAVDANGVIWGYWKGSEWIQVEYSREAETGEIIIGDDWNGKGGCGEIPDYTSTRITDGSYETIQWAGKGYVWASGSSKTIRKGTKVLDYVWSNVDEVFPDGCQVTVGEDYWRCPPGFPGATPEPNCATGKNMGLWPSVEEPLICSGEWRYIWYNAVFEQEVYSCTFREDEYNAAEYTAEPSAWIVSQDDPCLCWRVEVAVETTAEQTAARQKTGTISPGFNGMKLLKDEIIDGCFYKTWIWATHLYTHYEVIGDIKFYVGWNISGSTNYSTGFFGYHSVDFELTTAVEFDSESHSTYTWKVETMVDGTVVETEEASMMDPNDDFLFMPGPNGEPSWDHFRLRCQWYASDGEEAFGLSMPGGISTAKGDWILQRWVGDDLQIEGGYQDVSLASRPIGVA